MAFFLFMGSAIFFILCLILKPESDGYGTHRQLGLPACYTSKLLKVEKCPSCGLTTGCAHAVRLDFSKAQASNPLALWISASALLTLIASLICLFRPAMKYIYLLSGIYALLVVALLIRWITFF